MRFPSRAVSVFRVALTVAMVAPAASVVAQSAPVPDAPVGAGSFDGILRALDLKAKPAPRPDFVERSRPDDDGINYMPVGAEHPARTTKTLTPAEVAAATADLDRARMAQQRRAGVKPVPVPLKAHPARKPAGSITR